MKQMCQRKIIGLIALTVMVGFTVGIALDRALRPILAPREKPVAQLVRELQTHDSSWSMLRRRLWVRLPDAITSRFPSLAPRSAVSVRQEAAEELRRRGLEAKEAAPALCSVLQDPDPNVRLVALQALEQLGPLAEASVPNLIRWLEAPETDQRISDEFRKDALVALSRVAPQDPRVLVVANDAVRRNFDPKVRIAAVQALARSGPLASSLIPGLIELYHSTTNKQSSFDVFRGELILALAGIAPSDPRVLTLAKEALNARSSPQSGLAKASVESLTIVAQTNNSAVSALVLALEKSGVHFDELWPIHGKDPSAYTRDDFEDLTKRFLDRDEPIALSKDILNALGQIGPRTPEVLPAVIAALQSRNPGIREAAMEALGAMGVVGAEAIPVLLELLAEARKPKVAQSVAGDSNERHSNGSQWRLISIDSPTISAAAMRTNVLLRYGLLPRTPERLQIVRTLGKMGSAAKIALPSIIAECHDRSNPWRYEAALARRQIDGRTDELKAVFRDGLQNEPVFVRRRIVAWLAQIGADALPELIAAVTNANQQVRVDSINALRELGSAAEPAVPMLEMALSDSKAMVRLAAARALRQIQPDHPALPSPNSPTAIAVQPMH